MTNKTLGKLLATTLIALLVVGVLETGLSPYLAEFLYTILGIAVFVIGGMASYRLIKML